MIRDIAYQKFTHQKNPQRKTFPEEGNLNKQKILVKCKGDNYVVKINTNLKTKNQWQHRQVIYEKFMLIRCLNEQCNTNLFS